MNVVLARRTTVKRVIAEMGGKDAIVVDNNVDTDLAAEAIVTSAFGFWSKMLCVFSCHSPSRRA